MVSGSVAQPTETRRCWRQPCPPAQASSGVSSKELPGELATVHELISKTTVIRTVAVGVAAMATAVAVGACAATPTTRALPASGAGALANGNVATAPSGSASPSTTTTTPPSARTTSPPSVPTPTITAKAPTPACEARNFTAIGLRDDGAPSTSYFSIEMTNQGNACIVPGLPALFDTRPDGSVVRVPFVRVDESSSPSALVVPHGKTAAMVVHIPDGYGGYAPGDAACAHPALYRHLSVRVGTARVAVPSFTLDVKCEGVSLASYWSLA